MPLVRVFFCLLLISSLMTGCAQKTQLTTFQPPPDISVEGDEAWDLLIKTIKDHYPGIEIANKDSGEIKSNGIVTNYCWAGLAYGGRVPCGFERIIARVSSLKPFKADIAVQKHKGTAMSNYQNIVEDGNNREKEQFFTEALTNNLANRPYVTPSN